MRWTERQRTMLQAMGLRLWLPGAPQEEGAALETPAKVAAGAASPPDAAAKTPDRAPASAPAGAAPAVTTILVQAAPPVAADAPPTSTLDWPALRAAVVDCRACALCGSRRQTVFGVGNVRSQLMVVGEAPGEQEDLCGEPFVGAAGRLLDRMLAALGLTRGESEPARQVYIANTLKCRPPHNRNPEAAELAACRPFLERQVALVQPRVILAMGRFAVQSLLESAEPIGRLRGQVHRWRGCPLVVTYHPAYLLRNPADKARAWADLCLAATLLEAATTPS
jgi:uracil-DNA glycosylase family 4